MGQIILVTGGVRSGKSSFAERCAARCAAESGTAVAYIATAQIYDAEMQLRVDLRHRFPLRMPYGRRGRRTASSSLTV